MIQIRDIKLPVGHGLTELQNKIKKICFTNSDNFEYRIVRQSIDARKKPDIYYIYTVNVDFREQEKKIKSILISKKVKNINFDIAKEYSIPELGRNPLTNRPIIVGSGPAGLFAAYLLAQRGFCPIVIERGDKVAERTKNVTKTFTKGTVDPESNVQFGEGGAGTFSDGKLNTLTKDVNGRNTYVLRTFADFGAKESITYAAKPHIGTDKLCEIIVNMRNKIIELGGSFMFNTKLIDFMYNDDHIEAIKVINTKTREESLIDCNIVLLCIGHSARDTFEMLYSNGINMEPKSFAVGFRVQHPQKLVNMWQYGCEDPTKLGLENADYKVTNECSNGRRVYSFCMCPGGFVVNASSENNRLCVNGMSYSGRDSEYANSAIIVGITPDDFIQDEVSNNHPLRGMYYQRRIEEEAYSRGKGNICGQLFVDYELDRPTISFEGVDTCTKGIVNPGNLRGIFDKEIDEAVIESMHRFGYTRKAFDSKEVVMYGVEARTSSPVRIIRNDNMQANVYGLYPCGEGAGYAGGITSAAVDGMKVAEAIIAEYYPDL